MGFDVHGPVALGLRLAADFTAVGGQCQLVPVRRERDARISGGDLEGRRRREREVPRLAHARALLVAGAAAPATAPESASASSAHPFPPNTPTKPATAATTHPSATTSTAAITTLHHVAGVLALSLVQDPTTGQVGMLRGGRARRAAKQDKGSDNDCGLCHETIR